MRTTTRTKHNAIGTILLITGCFFVLSIPAWLSYTLIATTAVVFLTYTAIQYSQLMNPIVSFCFEFLKFTLMVTIFVITLTFMYGLITVY